MSKPLDKARLQQLAKVLKSQGLSVNTRSVAFKHGLGIYGGKTLKEWNRKLDPVLSGKAEIVKASKVSPKERNIYEHPTVKPFKSGKRSKEEWLLVPKSLDEKVSVKDKHVVIETPAGITKIEIPVPYYNLDQWLADFDHWIKEHPELRKLLKSGSYRFAFRYWGGSSATFRHLDQLHEYFTHYKSVLEALDGSPYQQREVYRNFELVVTKSAKFWNKERDINLAESRKRKRRKRK